MAGAGLYSLEVAGGGGDSLIGGRSWPCLAVVAGSARAEQRSDGRVHQEVKAIIYREILLHSHIATQFIVQVVGILCNFNSD